MAKNDDKLCTMLDACGTPEAPLCPMQEVTLKRGIWYCDEPICGSETFQELGWIKKQRCIAAMKLKADDGFFTVRMLNALHVVSPGIKGADPDSEDPENEWLRLRHSPEAKAVPKKAQAKNLPKKPLEKPAKNSAKKAVEEKPDKYLKPGYARRLL
jgi:hypothetical protein